MKVLEREKLYGNLKKCSFLTNKVTFRVHIITAEGIQVDEAKIDAIRCWAMPQSIRNVCIFHGFASFYTKFIQNFSTITVPMTEVLRSTSFRWTPNAQIAFEDVKAKLAQAPVSVLPCFDEVFKVKCDMSGVGTG